MIFGSVEPLESYCAHLLLSKDEIYFSVLETKGSRSLYGPRPTVQVHIMFGFDIVFSHPLSLSLSGLSELNYLA